MKMPSACSASFTKHNDELRFRKRTRTDNFSGGSMHSRSLRVAASTLSLITVALLLSCNRVPPPKAKEKPAPTRPSDIKVEVKDGGPLVLTTGTAEFNISPS